MGHKTFRTNYRVVIEPRGLGDLGYMSMSDTLVEPDEARRNARYKSICEEIAADIRRHVDSVGHVSVECDAELRCEHCGYAWTEGRDSPHNGGCCAKDCEVFDAEDAKATGEKA